MSDATYRIDTEWDPHTTSWRAKIIRLSDEMLVWIVNGEPSRGTARQVAREWVVAETASHESSESVYVDDQGEPVEQHSVKPTVAEDGTGPWYGVEDHSVKA